MNPPFCFAVYETGGTSGLNGEWYDDSPSIYSKPFGIVNASTISSSVATAAASTRAAQASQAAMSSYTAQIASAASSSAAALAYADAYAQEAHDKSVGLGVGLGLVFPIVVAASFGTTILLYTRRRQVTGDNASTTRSVTNTSVVYHQVGTEQQPGVGIANDEGRGRLRGARLSEMVSKMRASV